MSFISKHRRFDDDGKWIPGKVRIVKNSSLRKLMSAARRGKIPDDRQFIIDAAEYRAFERRSAYLNSSRAHSDYVAARMAAE